ncbi:MAG TPA: tyrosine-type recombinase/integrase, partial [Polyangiaceae bacterium]|nr:tyrosine-type recombinase/integrase [Polyangiaceae bacterium]
LRLITANPIPKGFMPKVKREKAVTYLYPDEDAKLMACEAVPLALRVFFGFLAREGLRAGEAAGLTLADVDLKRGAIRLDENKTDDPRAWALDPGVVGALRRWVELHRADAGEEDPLFTDEHGRSLNGEQLAARFRACLEKAGVSRPELFESSKARRPIRVHDLRASFVTVSLAEGRSETWIADRTGHRSSVMINRYKRAARTVADLGLGPFRPLDQAIPELGAREPDFPAYSPETLKTAEKLATPRRFELLLPA